MTAACFVCRHPNPPERPDGCGPECHTTNPCLELDEIDNEPLWPYRGKVCPDGPHRGPEGPNEDMGQCGKCGGFSFSMRPEGETFGRHWSDCSLPNRHQGECVGGGAGHPDAPKIRG